MALLAVWWVGFVQDADPRVLDREVERASEACRRAGGRLWVNDHWALAVKHRAYGLHVGQEDLLDLLAPVGRRRLLGPPAAAALFVDEGSPRCWLTCYGGGGVAGSGWGGEQARPGEAGRKGGGGRRKAGKGQEG